VIEWVADAEGSGTYMDHHVSSHTLCGVFRKVQQLAATANAVDSHDHVSCAVYSFLSPSCFSSALPSVLSSLLPLPLPLPCTTHNRYVAGWDYGCTTLDTHTPVDRLHPVVYTHSGRRNFRQTLNHSNHLFSSLVSLGVTD
jgi:hypothetical protein